MLATLIIWTWPALLLAVVLLIRAWRSERLAARVSVERADRETHAALLAAWELKQEQAQHEALRQRYNAEIGRWAQLALLAYQVAPDQIARRGYRQAMIDLAEATQFAEREAAA